MNLKDREQWRRYLQTHSKPPKFKIVRFAEVFANRVEQHILDEHEDFDVGATKALIEQKEMLGVGTEDVQVAFEILVQVWEQGDLLKAWIEAGYKQQG